MNNEVTIVTELVGSLCACKVIGAWSDWEKANAEAEKLRKEMREKGFEAIYETVTLVIDEGEQE
tara:strand:+ start:300 stop:491 length:192 start_codon:yes stop_codon:yes gene_type:complete